MNALKKQRDSIKAKNTLFSNHIKQLETSFPDKTITDQVMFYELEQRLQKHDILINDFDSIQTQIEALSGNFDNELSERDSFESSYYKNRAIATAFVTMTIQCQHGATVDSCRQPGSPNGSTIAQPSSLNLNHIKLPTIQLKRFNGELDEWLEFRDTFDSLINRNNAINDVQKFHYLRASLGRSTLQIIENLDFSSDNYSNAWKLICERFDNNRILIQNHVKALFNLNKIQDENSNHLRKILQEATSHLRALDMLKEPTSHWDTLIIYLIVTKLDTSTAREWEELRASSEKPTFSDMKEFLKNRADLLESIEHNVSVKNVRKPKPEHYNKTKSFVTSKGHCALCQDDHYIHSCSKFLNANVKQRMNHVQRLKLCMNCLRSDHVVGNCRLSSCRNCKKRHNTLLCSHNFPQDSRQPDTDGLHLSQRRVSENVSTSSNFSLRNSQVLLATAMVKVLDVNNKPRLARALLDPGSQSSFITVEFFNSLHINSTETNITVNGVNETRSHVNGKTCITIQSCFSNFKLNVSCLIIPQITGSLPNFRVNVRSLSLPDNIQLADENFYIPGEIDLLIGADCFWQTTCIGQIKLQSGPILQKTKFGWIVSGPSIGGLLNSTSCNLSSENQGHERQLNESLTRFWEIEELPLGDLLSDEQQFCEQFFQNTIKHNQSNQFVVTLPLNDSPERLGESFYTAKKMLFNLEKRFAKNPDFKNEYQKFMHEYRDLGHMQEVTFDDPKFSYYMPHHGVMKESSLTTKLRVVFNASSPTSTGYSFNDLQMVGPTIQPDLFTALVRHRQYNYVIIGDVEKMYRMCLVNPEQTSLQQILWRDNPNEEIKTYELSTVTYGTASASFQAIRCLKQIGLECSLPDISDIIQNHFYVDDLLSGGETKSEVIENTNKVIHELQKSGFKLRKFVSNSPDILQGIQSDDEVALHDLGVNENTRTLGLLWNGLSDTFIYKINDKFNNKVSKRVILSEVSQIFDPLGLLSPVIIAAKVLLQDLWCEKLGWDDQIPSRLRSKWLSIRDDLSCLNELSIPRQITCHELAVIDIHGFSDASSYAYGAGIYARSQDSYGQVFVNLICAKSKVAPLKTQTIPRLELTAALLLARLVVKVKEALKNLHIRYTTLWCDSTVVLGWLETSPHLLQTFAANRVRAIQELTNANQWRYVPGPENPADYISRGISPKFLPDLDIYWKGPCWLSSGESSWPTSLVGSNLNELPELKKTAFSSCHVTTQSEYLNFNIQNYSNLNRLQRVVAYCLRLKNNCLLKSHSERFYGPLKASELNQSKLTIIKISQNIDFAIETQLLQQKRYLPRKNVLSKLNPFLDDDQILRVGGRLSNSDFGYSKKYPIILSSKCHFTKLLFRQEHLRLLHVGPQHLLASIRDSFWPIGGRSLARKIVHECVKCFRAKPRPIAPIMGDLPSTRSNPSPVFHISGVDYTGPFLIRDRKGRGSKTSKCYICLFVCFSTRAIHLEIVSDLSMEAFLASLRRFISRRGKPFQLYSDNGTNFVSAARELRQLGNFLQQNSNAIREFAENESIDWSFIPPYSPHWGGLWESGVKSTKHHLRRVAGNAVLTFEQLNTLVVQIEAVLNSRPMTPLSSDPSDFTPLTPAHFIIGRPLTAAPDRELSDVPENRLSHFQHVQQIQQHFWKRWSREYISELQVRTKWSTCQGTLQINDLVVIKEDNQPSLKWALGRIINIYTGKDGVARVATLQTPSGIIKRSFTKICPLPRSTSDAAK